MSQTGYTPIQLYYSTTASNTPSVANLSLGELGINLADQKAYMLNAAGTAVVTLVGTLGNQNANSVSITGGSVNGTTIGATTASTGAFTTISATGVITSTVATGTAPFTIASTTQVANLNAATAGTATNATNVGTTDNTSSSSTYYPTLVSATSGNNPITTSSTKLSFVPSTGVLTTTGHNLTGLTASSAVATDASKNLVSVTNTGSGNNVLATTPTITTPNISGNLTFTSSNAGIIFDNSSALTNSTLNDYEVGTYTPTDQSGAGLTFSFARTSVYTKIGNIVNVQIDLTFPSTASTSGASISLPFTNTNFYSGSILTENGGYGSVLSTEVVSNGASFGIQNTALNTGLTNLNLSGKRLIFNIFYRANF